MKSNRKKILIILGSVVLLNIASSYVFKRFDLTQDNRFTLTSITHRIVDKVEEPLYIDIFLDGDLPAEFKRLRTETKQIVEEYQALNSNIIFRFVNVSDNEETSFQKAKELFKKGMTPVNLTVTQKGKQTQLMVFPWATASYLDKEVNVPLLKNIMGVSTEEKVIGSVQHLEYSFSDAINKLVTPKEKKIAFIRGNGEMPEIYRANFMKQLIQSYYIAPFTLDSVAKNPLKTLADLKKYDLAIIAKPTEKFSDAEKQVLDQYIINGGKSFWLVDQVNMELDSLYNDRGENLAFPNDLNLNDMFFKYGIRLTPDLIKDEMGTPLKLASGEQGTATQFQEFNWKFAPFIFPDSRHPIVKNLGGIKFSFASPIEILKNNINKTVLLHTSANSKKIGTPTIISLNMVSEETDPKEYQGQGLMPVSVLLEGNFHSVYENRILPFDQKDFVSTGKNTKMIVVSDGDVIKNSVDKDGIPLELGLDPKIGTVYDNKDFAMNAVNYLLDDTGLINIRSKDISLPLLDKMKVEENYTQTQVIAVVLPLVLLTIFGFLFTFLRKRKYGKVITNF